ncbi:MAG: cation:proton antiporter [Methanobacteriota archaeon]|nr:MAG: cation:proton antiporter [Euryarchaeota archaeon]
MIDTGYLVFEMGIVMLIAFIGAGLATRLKQSVIIGYMIAGILIGPYMTVNIFGLQYEGLIRDFEFIEQLAHIGLILLLFFVGLGFSIEKLKKTKEPAMILAFINLGINMFAGFALGAFLGWPLLDTFFLTGVIALSSATVTAKVLIELKKLGKTETEYLIGMIIVQDFLAILLLAVAGGMIVQDRGSTLSILALVAGIVLFILFFIFLALVVIPKVAKYFENIQNEEMFVLFALGMVFLASAMAELLGIPAIIGAFFIGMVFADTKISSRLKKRLVSLRDAFVAIFFISFGMMINPAMFPSIINILILAVPLIILNDIFITSALAYLIGFSPKASTSIGTSLVGRGAESVLYAKVGSDVQGATKGEYLYPFAGAFCFIMSALAPIFMKKSDALCRFLKNRISEPLKYGGRLVSRVVKTMVMPHPFPIYRRNKRLVVVLTIFTISCIMMVVTSGSLHILALILSAWSLYYLWFNLADTMGHPTRRANFPHKALSISEKWQGAAFVTNMIMGALISIALVCFVWIYIWWVSILVLLGYLVYTVVSMKSIYHRLVLKKQKKKVIKLKIEAKPSALKESWKVKSRVYNRRNGGM